MTGSTDTSLWTVYKNGVRNYCGNLLPDGTRHTHSVYFCLLTTNSFILKFNGIYSCATDLVKSQRLPANILTPTTKAADHDVPVTPDEVSVCDALFIIYF